MNCVLESRVKRAKCEIPFDVFFVWIIVLPLKFKRLNLRYLTVTFVIKNTTDVVSAFPILLKCLS